MAVFAVWSDLPYNSTYGIWIDVFGEHLEAKKKKEEAASSSPAVAAKPSAAAESNAPKPYVRDPRAVQLVREMQARRQPVIAHS